MMSPLEKDSHKGLNGAIAAIFRAEKAALKMTTIALSEKCEIPERTLYRLLQGDRAMDLASFGAIAKALNLSIDSVLENAEQRRTLTLDSEDYSEPLKAVADKQKKKIGTENDEGFI